MQCRRRKPRRRGRHTWSSPYRRAGGRKGECGKQKQCFYLFHSIIGLCRGTIEGLILVFRQVERRIGVELLLRNGQDETGGRWPSSKRHSAASPSAVCEIQTPQVGRAAHPLAPELDAALEQDLIEERLRLRVRIEADTRRVGQTGYVARLAVTLVVKLLQQARAPS